MTTWSIDTAALELRQRQLNRRSGPRLTGQWAEFDLDDAYQVQSTTVRMLEQAGERIVGVKLGLTSPAKQQRMGVATPITGWLTDAMILAPNELLAVDTLIHPRVEPEIAFVLGSRLDRTGITADDALAAVRSVHAGLEVIDSRFTDYSFALPDVVADNASAARFILSEAGLPPDALDLAIEQCLLGLDGVTVASGTGADVLSHPAEALALAANALAERGIALRPGWIVLTGGITDAVAMTPGHEISATFASLGSIHLIGAGSDHITPSPTA